MQEQPNYEDWVKVRSVAGEVWGQMSFQGKRMTLKYAIIKRRSCGQRGQGPLLYCVRKLTASDIKEVRTRTSKPIAGQAK